VGAPTGSRMVTTTLSRAFSFDLACHEDFDQQAVFDHCGAASFVDAALEGVKATVLAYGATSSGKTYTMSGLDQSSLGADAAGMGPTPASSSSASPAAGLPPSSEVSATRELQPPPSSLPSSSGAADAEGLIQKSARYLFQRVSERHAAGRERFTITASYCEVYHEHVFDLLQLTGRHLAVRHQPVSDEFYVPGLLEVRCEGLSDVMAVLEEGHLNRRRASHDLNQDSSRSHSLLTLHVHGQTTAHLAVPSSGTGSGSSSGGDGGGGGCRGGGGVLRKGKLVFVDLAGSERLKRSKNSDAEETGAINKSLFTLAKVISLLADHADNVLKETANHNHSVAAAAVEVLSEGGAGGGAASSSVPHVHIPYRDSVLTKLLSDALGGNALALFIACVSPSDARSEESLATLHYAMRARSIRNRPKVQVEGGGVFGGGGGEAELRGLREEVVRLRGAVPQLEAEVESLKDELALAHFEMEKAGLSVGGSAEAVNGSLGLATSPLRGGRPADSQALSKSKLSKDGQGMRGRPPPGAAGRDLRETHEKLRVSKNDVRRLETSLVSSAKSEQSCRKEAQGLRHQLDQLQALLQTSKQSGGESLLPSLPSSPPSHHPMKHPTTTMVEQAASATSADPLQSQPHQGVGAGTYIGGACGGGGGGGEPAAHPGNQQVQQLVCAQREGERSRATALRLRQENAQLVEKYGQYVKNKDALEERAHVAEQSLDQITTLNTQLQAQLRERDDEIARLDLLAGQSNAAQQQHATNRPPNHHNPPHASAHHASGAVSGGMYGSPPQPRAIRQPQAHTQAHQKNAL